MPAAKRGKQSTPRRKASAEQAVVHEKAENVFLFVPNLIGYARVILASISLYFMRDNPRVCTVLYGVSCLLDVFDGMLARRLDQSTKFGAVLDMVTDRCTTSCLLCFLGAAYPRCALLFMFLVTLDFSSHYIHMYSTLVTGNKSHKVIDSSRSRILSMYYTDTLFFVCLYLMAFYKQPLDLDVLAIMPKSLVAAIATEKSGWVYYVLHSYVPSLTWPQILGAVTFPVCAGKQIINCVQFWKAAKTLADIDVQERRARRSKK